MASGTPVRTKTEQRSCGTCTKCCEGHLVGEVRGIPFHLGKPCHFLKIDVGCSIYEDRPEKPCKSFKCMWLTEPNLPEWLKPNLINAMFVPSEVEGHKYIFAIEAGEKMEERTISWAKSYMSSNNLNFAWQHDGKWNAMGSVEFIGSYFGANVIIGNKTKEIDLGLTT
jgi:uncharacterized cysteine cluster protein YcgN (CxxCxxCC family)